MSASLVGSEMCIRDRAKKNKTHDKTTSTKTTKRPKMVKKTEKITKPKTVSYTHLTLPTICSV
eukprot:9447814-Alexandrium_andersonii.AAC.1